MADYSWLFDVLKPAVQWAGNNTQNNNQSNYTNDMYEQMMAAENQNYQNSMAEYEARNAYNAQARGAAAQGDANRRGALANAQNVLAQGHKKAMKPLRPYMKAGKEVLPYHTNTAKGGMQGMDMLAAYMQQQPMLKPTNSMSEINLGQLPSTLFGGK